MTDFFPTGSVAGSLTGSVAGSVAGSSSTRSEGEDVDPRLSMYWHTSNSKLCRAFNLTPRTTRIWEQNWDEAYLRESNSLSLVNRSIPIYYNLYSATRPNFCCYITLQALELILNFNLSKMVLWNYFPQLVLHLFCKPTRGRGFEAQRGSGKMSEGKKGDANVFRCH